MNLCPPPSSSKRRTALVVSLLLMLAIWAVFDQVRGYDFVHYDDDTYVVANRQVQQGLTPSSVSWAFTATEAAFWHPLTWLSLMLDYELYGLHPGGYHGTNLIWHMANTLLLLLVFSALTGCLWRSAFVAALFAIHPLHVESVAWIAERKDVLSTFFWLATMGAYLHYVRQPGLIRYLLVLGAFSLGLMAKPMLVTLPFCLLLLDFWPLGRTPLWPPVLPPDREGNKEGRQTQGFAPLIVEKIPLMLLALFASLLVYYTESRAGVLSSLTAYPLTVRLSHAVVSYVLYLGKTFYPLDLAVFYPHPGPWPLGTVLAALGLLLGITFLALRRLSRFPYAACGWLWYLGTMVPLIGFVQLGTQGMADRYSYISLIGIFVMIAWGVPDLLKKWSIARPAFPVLAVAVLFLLGFLAWRQAGFWRDGETLFRQALRVTKNNYVAHNNLGAALTRQGNFGAALGQYEAALRINPYYADARYNMGQALAALERPREAEGHYREALQSKPTLAEAHNNLAILLATRGKREEALAHLAEALRIRPDYEAARKNIMIIMKEQSQGKLPEGHQNQP